MKEVWNWIIRIYYVNGRICGLMVLFLGNYICLLLNCCILLFSQTQFNKSTTYIEFHDHQTILKCIRQREQCIASLHFKQYSIHTIDCSQQKCKFFFSIEKFYTDTFDQNTKLPRILWILKLHLHQVAPTHSNHLNSATVLLTKPYAEHHSFCFCLAAIEVTAWVALTCEW